MQVNQSNTNNIFTILRDDAPSKKHLKSLKYLSHCLIKKYKIINGLTPIFLFEKK